MVFHNSVILYGDDEQIDKIKQSQFFRKKDTVNWKKTASGKGSVISFYSSFEIPMCNLNDVSRDFPSVKINHYHYIIGETLILGYRKFLGGKVSDQLLWSNTDNQPSSREDAFAKRFFATCCPHMYNEIFVS
jgi:hypothetical protein